MKLVCLVVLLAVKTVLCQKREREICFDGSSYVRYAIPENDPKFAAGSAEDKIKFKFRSTHASGLLLYAYSRGLNGDHVLLELVRGKLRVRYQLGPNSTLQQAILGDGLGDEIVSTVIVKRKKKELTVYAYGGQSDQMTLNIPGDDDRLDLNRYIFIGSYPNGRYPSFHGVGFRGCMTEATFNNVDFVDGALNNRKGFKTEKILPFKPRIPQRAMNFNNQTFLTFDIQQEDPSDNPLILQKFYGSFEFRTVLVSGTIFHASSVALRFQRSQLILVSGGSDQVTINFPNEGTANDGRWFRVEYVVENGNMELKLDDVVRRIVPKNNPQFLSKITYGFYQNTRYFIGCIRNLRVQKTAIDYYDIVYPYRGTKLADYRELTEGCKASDPCVPNPCFHGAACMTIVQGLGVRCICRQSYRPPLCQFSQLQTSCTAKKDFEPGTVAFNRGEYNIDPDDSGPLPPVKVTCDYNLNSRGVTEIKAPETTIPVQIPSPVRYSARFSYKKEIVYEIPIESVKAIVDRSEHCRQYVKYSCKDAPLFNAPGGKPSSRWLSANGYLQYYWGGARPDSYKCACAYTSSCRGGGFCNCDSPSSEIGPDADDGLLNVTRDLPVREVQFGDMKAETQAIYTISKVDCYGLDTIGAVTFLAPDGWIRAPSWNSPYGGDISFYIKTVATKGDLVDHRSSDETYVFQIRLYSETTIQVVISTGTTIRTRYNAGIPRPGKLNDNKWHRIHVVRTLWQIYVKIDNKDAVNPNNNEKLQPLPLTGNGRSRFDSNLPMFVGAFWRFPVYRNGYVGCMKGFTINGVIFDLVNAIDNIALEPEVLVVKGCGNACARKPCPFGTCVDKYTSFECNCQETPFYGTYCTKEIGASMSNWPTNPVSANVTINSVSEKIVLAFSTASCSGTLFELRNNVGQYYRLRIRDEDSLDFEFKLRATPAVVVPINIDSINFCDTARHIVNIERTSNNRLIKYMVDGRRQVILSGYTNDANAAFNLMAVANFSLGRQYDGLLPFEGCISGAKFHFFASNGVMKTVEPIVQVLNSNSSNLPTNYSCGPTINTPVPMTTRIVPGPTTPTDYASTEFLRDVGIHEAEDTNWAVVIVVALLLMLVLIAVVVLTVWFLMQHKSEYQILENADGTVVGTATVRGGASMASVPGHGSVAAARAPPSVASTGNLSRGKSKSNDLFV
ncbi:EGF and laminin G domain-containing protein-like [Xenia sp. Carnegie-2017]|uniref:EGF and laminin G domain-containing protein-like n=1 Tax=Xenia sp. Carnegie-2017 TaxID=2897299 RepID=UPI001F035DED|nr:EGF and laminin G domain-containing protein-like [Xenia sp. Carnegie-2017]